MFVSLFLVGCGGSLTREEKAIVGSHEQTLGDETYRWAFLEHRSYEKSIFLTWISKAISGTCKKDFMTRWLATSKDERLNTRKCLPKMALVA